MIDLSDLSLVLPGGRKLFDGLNWRVDKGSKVGLMGRNGEGKTTLLRLITGEIQPDGGKIILAPSGVEVGYLPQDLAELPDGVPLMAYLKEQSGITALEEEIHRRAAELEQGGEEALKAHGVLQERYEALGGYQFEAWAAKTLSGLGFKPGDFFKPCGQFSGGWRMRISLASLLLRRPPILLLDEPTNHLDTESMEWLENRLRNENATLVIISHDRVFMDKIVTAVAHLENGGITVFSGNYSHYLEAKAQWEERRQKENEAKRREIAHLQSFVDRFRYKESKARQAQARVKMIQKLGPLEEEAKRPKGMALRFPACPPSGRVVLQAENLGKIYGQNRVFSGLNFEILKGEKVALVGYNGSGKSTLSRLLAQTEAPSEGTVAWGHQVRTAYFAQTSAENLDYGLTVWESVSGLALQWSPAERRALLGRFAFGDDDLSKPVSALSGGEKSRLALARLTMTPSNFIILDEPTNHLDDLTRELFEEALLTYQGTLLIVSHDRSFLNRLAGRVFEIRDGVLYDYRGNYDWFIERRAANAAALASQSAVGAGSADRKEEKRRQGQRRNELYRRLKPHKERLALIEKEIEVLEARLADLEAAMADPEAGGRMAELSREYGDGRKELDERMELWESLMETIGAIEAEEA